MSIQNDVGKILADFTSYAYNGFQTYGIKWQCVWYVRGRAYEKLKKNTGIRGNGNQWFGAAKSKGLTTGYEPHPNSIACYDRNKYGHVAYVEDVIDNVVYYSEANITGDGKKSSDDGKVKKLSVGEFKKLNGYQGCIYLTDEKPKFTPKESFNVAKTYKNGSTVENVYAESNFKTKIGSLNKYEQCECLAKVDDAYLVKYKINGISAYKTGFVKYSGGVK